MDGGRDRRWCRGWRWGRGRREAEKQGKNSDTEGLAVMAAGGEGRGGGRATWAEGSGHELCSLVLLPFSARRECLRGERRARGKHSLALPPRPRLYVRGGGGGVSPAASYSTTPHAARRVVDVLSHLLEADYAHEPRCDWPSFVWRSRKADR